MNMQASEPLSPVPAAAGGADVALPEGYDRQLAEALDEMDRESPLTEYFQVLWRRRWIVLAATVLSLLLALFISWTTVPLYRSTLTMEIAREAAKIVDTKSSETMASVTGQEFYSTQYGLLKSRSLAEKVVEELRLEQNPTFMFGYTGDDAKALAGGDRKAMRAQATGQLQRHLTITPLRNSGLVSISFDSPDPSLSQKIADAIAERFIASSLARRFESSAYARRFLEEQIQETRAKLETSERALVDYAGNQRLVNTDVVPPGKDGVGGSPGHSVAEEEMTGLNQALVGARTDRITAEARFNQATRRGGLALSESLSDSSISELRKQRAQLQADYQRMSNRLKPDYPSMVALQQQIREIERQLGSQGTAIVSSLRSNYEAARQRENELQARVESLKSHILNERSRSIQMNIFQRDADTNRVLYDALLQRYKEIGIAGGVGTNNVSIVDSATKSGAPIVPRTSFNLLLGLLGGLLAGGLLAFLLEQLDESIVAPHDLERKLGVPMLGSVPRIDDGSVPIDHLDDRKSDIAEAYLSIQTALQFTTDHGAPRTLLITSARASEGKSTTSVATARNLAGRGRRVLLIDGDMRNPSIHKIFGFANTQGYSDLLSGFDDISALVRRGAYEGLAVMTSGPLPPNPAELLTSPRLPEMLKRLGETFDHVVIDGPPVMGLADSPIMAANVEGTVFVVAATETRAKAARIALRRLVDVKAHIVGAVLTKFNAKQVGYGYSYGYGYNYGDRAKSRTKLLGR